MDKQVKYHLNAEGEFIIDNYHLAKTFANFFPGIAGKYGIPMWTFYVNRGQAISSFGTKDKDHAILEFFPANKAWQLVNQLGFRTFIKILNGKKITFYEPFHNGLANLDFDLRNQMRISSYDLKLQEDNATLGLRTQIEYFNIPNDSYAALARVATITNTSRKNKTIQLLDGLPQIVPFGTNNFFLKKMGRTIEAWMTVENLNENAPFYKLSVDPSDRPEVIHITAGNFYLGFYHDAKGKAKIIKPIVDPQTIFSHVNDFSYPHNFIHKNKFGYPKEEACQNKMPSGFSLLNIDLSTGQEITIYSIIGNMRSKQLLNSSISRITDIKYIPKKRSENKEIINQLQSNIYTKSSSSEFDFYAKQTYLDNIMRGGYPITFSNNTKANPKHTTFYLYSRKHGDLERDYNRFLLQPTYFSQGNGNYRDINQNQRCDIWFNPAIKDDSIIHFLNLIQSDGFNPLVVKGVNFTINDLTKIKQILSDTCNENDAKAIASFLGKSFTPGELILFIQDNNLTLNKTYDDFLNALLPECLKHQEAEHTEGFWTDHWTYNLDLIETYLDVYPENLKEIVFEKNVFTFFDNTEIVRPRKEKYTLRNGRLLQLHSLICDNAKKEMIRKRQEQPNVTRSEYGLGDIYQTTLLNKLLCLFANKLASLDPFGVGVEMEADKPNWFDSLNGLPGLLGSSSCESFELKRLAIFIKEALSKTKISQVHVTAEILNFILELNNLIISAQSNDSKDNDYSFWENSHNLKEKYRHDTKLGFSGKETPILAQELTAILDNAIVKITAGIAKAYDNKSKLFYSYFINEPLEHKPIDGAFIMPTRFKQTPLPFFLESQVHALRINNNLKDAKALYTAVKKSELFDQKLKNYKVTSPLKSMPEEIGRCRVFSPGWLENESIWLHMEYKYLLELLKNGLGAEFYSDFKNTLIPFLNPQQYGRNILENSSFIVSSAFPDKNLHGNGFVARLSGSTAEFIQIWLTMNLGNHPFRLNNENELNLKLSPILPAWLFDLRKNNTYSFNLFGSILVTYHNPRRKDTFASTSQAKSNFVTPIKIRFNDAQEKPVEISSDTIPAPYAQQIRSLQIKKIDIYLG